MTSKKEVEIIDHSKMEHLKIFLVEMSSRTPHGHNDLEIGVLLDGTMEMTADEEHYSLQKNDIYIISRYQIHSFQKTSPKALILAFQIHDSFYRKINAQLHFLHIDHNVLSPEEGELHTRIMSELFSCAEWYFGSQPFHDLKCASSILEILYTLFSCSYCSIISPRAADIMKQNSVRLNHFTDYIGEHFAEPISLEDLAALENISSYYVSHYFKDNLGISFQEYLNNIRFRHAYSLVRHTDLKIMDICLESGFSSSRYLNQMFQQKLGMTVKEYRRAEVKPEFLSTSTALPGANKQKAYDHEQSAFLFKKVTTT